MKKLLLIALFAWNTSTFAQNSILGTVKGDEGALPGATVQIENTFRAMVSDADGKFAFDNVKNGEYTLLINFMGYEPLKKVVTVPSTGTINISLKTKTFLTNEVLITSTRADKKSAMTYTELSKKEIEEKNFGQDLPILLKNTPSVVTTSDAGTGVGYTGIRIRGSDATRINVTINGIPLNDAESGGVFWVNLPDLASSMESVQIQRGVGTSTNGAAAFGGSINILTGTPSTESYANTSMSYGSFNTLKNNVSFGTGLINNHWNIDARLSKITSDGYVDRATSDLKSFYVSGTYRNKNTLLKLNIFSGKEVTYQSWYGVPEWILDTNRTYNQYTYENQVDNYQQDHYQFHLAQKVNEKLTLNGALHFTHGEGYFEEFQDVNDPFAATALNFYGLDNVIVGTDTITNTDIIRRRWLDNDFYGATASLYYNASKKLSLKFGGGWHNYEGVHFGEVIWARFASNGNIQHRYYDNKGDKRDANAFVKSTYDFNSKTSAFVDLQFRSVKHEITYDDIMPLVAIPTLYEYEFFNPKIGLTQQIKNGSLYASFAVGNKEPTRTDILDGLTAGVPTHETLYDYELGADLNWNKFRMHINLFHMQYDNQLVLTGEVNGDGFNIKRNVKESYRQGVETTFAYQFSNKLTASVSSLLGNTNISKFEHLVPDYDSGGNYNNGTTSGGSISFSPDIIANASINYKPIKNLSLNLTSKYVGEQFLDNTANSQNILDAYTVADFTVEYNLKIKGLKNIKLGTLVSNVFNEEYESNGYAFSYFSYGAPVTDRYYFPQAGTNVLGRITIDF